MNISQYIRTLFLLITGYLSIANACLADDILLTNNLTITPTRCVALHQGQNCYQKITILWQASEVNDYCLVIKETNKQLHCWQKTLQAKYRYEFSGDTAEIIQLINQNNQLVIAETKIELAWVYKSNTRRKTHWRLF
jgi:hypothetical protein